MTGKELKQMIDDIACSENNIMLAIQNIEKDIKSNNVEYILKFCKEPLLLCSCKQNKSIVSKKLLEIYDSIIIKSDLFLAVIDRKDEFKKTALNYAILNNMREVALKILAFEKIAKESPIHNKHLAKNHTYGEIGTIDILSDNVDSSSTTAKIYGGIGKGTIGILLDEVD